MPRLIARTPFQDLLPLSIGSVTARELDLGPVTSIAVRRDAGPDVSKALQAAIGVGLPDTGAMAQSDDATVAWAGLDTWFVIGAEVPDIDGALLTDQSDAWAIAEIEGAGARDALARLVPIDLGPGGFPEHRIARTNLGHLSCLLWRHGREAFRVLVFRSMAGTAAHDLDRAMRMVAARQAIGGDASATA